MNHVEFLVELYSSCYCWLQEEGEDTGEGLRMGKRLLRSLALVFGCVAISSLVWWFLRSFGVTHGSVLWYPKLLASVTINTEADIFFWVLGSWYNISIWLFSWKERKRKEGGREGSIHLIILFSYFTSRKTKLFFIMVWRIINIPFFNLYWISYLKRIFIRKKFVVAHLQKF